MPNILTRIDSCKTMTLNIPVTPPESPDRNPIENLRYELKEYIRREVKPTIRQELIDGITRLWATVTAEKCTKYIHHLRKVLPKVIDLDGTATGF